MNVTNVEIYPIKKEGIKLKANGSVTLANFVKLKFVIVEGAKGNFVSWKGTEKGNDGKYYSPIIFITKEDNESVKKEILNKFVENAGSAPTQTAGSVASDSLPF